MDCSFVLLYVFLCLCVWRMYIFCVTTNCTTKWHNMANNFRVNCVRVCFICVTGLKSANIYAHKLPFWQKINSIRNRATYIHTHARNWLISCAGADAAIMFELYLYYIRVWFNPFRHFFPVWLLRFIFNPRAKLSKIYNSLSHLFIFQCVVACACVRMCVCVFVCICERVFVAEILSAHHSG